MSKFKAKKSIRVGLSVNSDIQFYIHRPHDEELRNLVAKMESASIIGPRQSGKTSAARHVANELKDKVAVEVLDCTQLKGASLGDAGQIVWTIAKVLSNQIGQSLNSGFETDPAIVRFRSLFTGWRRAAKKPVYLFLDEFDSLKGFKSAEQLFAMLKVLNEDATDREYGMGVIAVERVYELDPRGFQSGVLNLSQPVTVRPFPQNKEVARLLADNFEPSLPLEAVDELISESGGHAFMTMLLLTGMIQLPDLSDTSQRKRLWEEKSDSAEVELLRQVKDYISYQSSRDISFFPAVQAIATEGSHAATETLRSTMLTTGAFTAEGNKVKAAGRLFQRFLVSEIGDIKSNADKLGQLRGRTSEDREARKVCVINTGGTIGMVDAGGRVEPTSLERFRALFPLAEEIADFRSFSIVLDSVNIEPRHWEDLVHAIEETKSSGYDGVVVLHGTDTMAFTASAVAMAFGPELDFPIVFTGAQATPDVMFADGVINVYRAIKVAQQGPHQVLVCFGDRAFRAVRVQKKDDRYLDGFESLTEEPVLRFASSLELNQDRFRWSEEVKAQWSQLSMHSPINGFADDVLQVQVYPGMSTDHLFAMVGDWQRVNGIIMVTLGAGNVPTSVLPFIDAATAEGVPVIITSQHPPLEREVSRYAPAREAIIAGAIHGGNMALGAVSAKLRWVVSLMMKTGEWSSFDPAARVKRVGDLMLIDRAGELVAA